MKTTILSIAICCFLSFNLTAQEVFRIKNASTNTYLRQANGTLTMSEVNADLQSEYWEFIKMESGHYRFRNVNDDTFLNLENETLKSSEIEYGWWSAMWAIQNVEGTNQFRIQSRWQDTRYLHTQNGLGCTEIQNDWRSALWEKEVIDPSLLEQKPHANIMDAQKVLDAHNRLRSEVGVQPLEWSVDLAFKAQHWADKVAKKNDGVKIILEHGDSGENIAGGFVTGDPPETRVFKGWGESEKPNFNPSTRKCYEGKTCGHYTQIVWRKSTKVGCGVAVNKVGEYILVCNYDPKGNWNREPAF